jgi:glycosyltransferase involved in cell wall biosynthesis
MATLNQVLYLSYDGLTDPLGQSQILPYLIGLSAKGYRFKVISFEKKNIFSQRKKEIEALCVQHAITWVPLPYHKSPPVLSTLYDLWILWRMVKKIVKQYPVSIVHCRSYITSLVGLAAKRRWGTRFIFDMRGFWADERVEGGLWHLNNPIYKIVYQFFKKKEKQFLVEADHIVSLTHNAKNEIESWGFLTAPIKVIPTCVDTMHFNPLGIPEESRVRKRAELGISPHDYLLVYSGSWGTWYLTDEMLRFFELLKNEKESSKFLIITPDTVEVSKEYIAKAIIIKKATRAEMPLLLNCANGTVFFIKPSFSKKASSATKLGEIMAMNIPVLTNGGWGDIRQYEGEGVVVLQNTSDGQLAEGAKKLLAVKRTLYNSRVKSLSLPFGIELYEQIYQTILLTVK